MANFGKWSSIFLNEIYQIKWFWRVLAFFILLFLTTNLIFAGLAGRLPEARRFGWQYDLNWLIIWGGLTAVAFFYTWLVLRILDKRKLVSVGMAFHAEWKRELVFGLLTGIIFSIAALGFLWIAGYATVQTVTADLGQAAVGLLIAIALWWCVAFFNELIFRGYIMQTMSEGLGNIAATIFMSVCYGFFQGISSQGTVVPVINMALFGFIFCIIYFRTRSLWMPLGLHFGYKFTESYIFGAPVSGTVTSFSLFRTHINAPEWVTGGPYGIEGGAVASVLLLGLLYYVSQSKQLRITETMRKIKYEALTTPFIKLPVRDEEAQ